MATLMCVRCDTGAPRCLSVLTAEKRDFPAQVREDGPCQDSRPKGPFCVYGPALGGVPIKAQTRFPVHQPYQFRPAWDIEGYRRGVDECWLLQIRRPAANHLPGGI